MLKVGNLTARRDFVHVEDGVEALALLVERGVAGEVYNVASGRALSIGEALERLVRVSGLEVTLEEDPERLRPVDVPLLCGDAGRLRALGWSGRHGFDAALEELWARSVRGDRRGGDGVRILVTGGTGFLGRRTVARLAERHALRLLVRPTGSRQRFPAGVEFAAGDVTDRASVAAAAAGCDAVLHAAALVKIAAPAAEFDRVNIGGLENVLGAAAGAGVRRVVYVSSFIALGPTERGPGGVLDESAPADDRRWINDYERTKTRADRRARHAIEAGIPLTVVYPGVIYGPGELTEGNIVVRHLLDLAHGRLPALLGRPERRWNYVFVDDVAAGVVAALERAAPGSRYVLGGENVTSAEFYRLAAELGAHEGAGAAHARRARQGRRRSDEGVGAPDRRRAEADARPGRDLPPRLGLRLLARPHRARLPAAAARRGAGRDLRLAALDLGVAAAVSGLSGAEIARKLVHMAVGGLAFAIRPLGFWGSLAAALAAVAHNAFLFPLYGGRRLWRTAEAERGRALGIVLYPIAVTLLVVCFAGRLEVAAAAWGILAFGDGMASVVGMTLGRGNPLPWNPRKSWAGTLAYFAFGTAAAAVLLLWTAPGRYPAGFALAVAAAAALGAALLESAPQGLDDNLGVPLVTGLLLYCLLLTQGHWGALASPELGRRAVVGLAVNAALAIAAFAARGVDRSGALAGILLGTVIWACLDWRGFLLLFAFFALGTLATRVGYEEKAKRKLAQEKGGGAAPGTRSPRPPCRPWRRCSR